MDPTSYLIRTQQFWALPTTITQHPIGPFYHQDLTAWAMPRTEPNALGLARRPDPATLGGYVSFKI